MKLTLQKQLWVIDHSAIPLGVLGPAPVGGSARVQDEAGSADLGFIWKLFSSHPRSHEMACMTQTFGLCHTQTFSFPLH